MTDVIILIRHARLPLPDVPPPFPVVLAAVERERRREQQLQPVADGAGEELRVDVEGERGVAVLRVRGQPGDAVVLLRVDGGEGEGVGEEVRVAHCCCLFFWGGGGFGGFGSEVECEIIIEVGVVVEVVWRSGLDGAKTILRSWQLNLLHLKAQPRQEICFKSTSPNIRFTVQPRTLSTASVRITISIQHK